MKSNKYISIIGQSIKPDFKIFGNFWKIMTITTSSLLIFSPLILNTPAIYWYLPLIGILLFTFSMTGILSIKNRFIKNVLQRMESLQKIASLQRIKSKKNEDLEYTAPVIITRFAQQNSKNIMFRQKVA
jgi:hypothetical protein